MMIRVTGQHERNLKEIEPWTFSPVNVGKEESFLQLSSSLVLLRLSLSRTFIIRTRKVFPSFCFICFDAVTFILFVITLQLSLVLIILYVFFSKRIKIILYVLPNHDNMTSNIIILFSDENKIHHNKKLSNYNIYCK